MAGEAAYLTGLQKTFLEDWRNKHWTAEDRKAEQVASVDPAGMVVWRDERWTEQVAYAIAKWLWDESVEKGRGLGE